MAAPKSVDARAISLDQLLDRVQSERAAVRIVRDGRAVADVTPIEDAAAAWQLAPVIEALKPIISNDDAIAPLDEEDWPPEARP